MDGNKETTYAASVAAFQNRPASFFAQNIKSLSVAGKIPLPFVALAVDAC